MTQIRVNAGQSIHTALETAQRSGGLEVIVEAGATFPSFQIPNLEGSDKIIVKSSLADEIDLSKSSVASNHGKLFTVLTLPSGPAISTQKGASHYEFVGMRSMAGLGGPVTSLFNLGSENATSIDEQPDDFTFDRCLFEASEGQELRRCLTLHGRKTVIKNSILKDAKAEGRDSQAVLIWNGPGPVYIVDSYLSAAGMPFMSGGADAKIPGLVPTDIRLERCDLTRPLNLQNSKWQVKTLFEIKNGRMIRLIACILSNCWGPSLGGAQDGYAIQFTPRNQSGGNEQAMCQDVLVKYCSFYNVEAGINMLYTDNLKKSGVTRDMKIVHNHFHDVGDGKLFQFLGDLEDIDICYNTAFNKGNITFVQGNPKRVRMIGNIANHNEYGFHGFEHFVDSKIKYNCVASNGPRWLVPDDNYSAPKVEDFFEDLDELKVKSVFETARAIENGGVAGCNFQYLVLAQHEQPESDQDITPPSNPTLSIGEVTHNSIHLFRTVVPDAVEYEVLIQSGITPAIAYAWPSPLLEINNLLPDTDYMFQVRCKDAAGNWSDWATPYVVRTDATPDTDAPASPHIQVVNVTHDTITVLRNDVDDAEYYEWTVDQANYLDSKPFTIGGLEPVTTHVFKCRAADLSGNWSEWTTQNVTTLGPPEPPPSSYPECENRIVSIKEYHSDHPNMENIQEMFNDFGKQGYEYAGPVFLDIVCFKRRKKTDGQQES